MRAKVLICSLLLVALAFGAPAWAAQVKICHVPPGNPANFHTITVSDSALQAHLAHGDLLGACFEHCEQLCDDGNACTIDACDATEQCLPTHPPVSCDDGNLCTNESCDPAMGCASTPKVCEDGALCTVDSCDPLTGACVFPPVACDAGECNPTTGSCENEVTCPCVNQLAGFAEALEGDLAVCLVSTAPGFNQVVLLTGSPNFVMVSTENIYASCSSSSGNLSITFQEGEACIALLRQTAAAAGLSCN